MVLSDSFYENLVQGAQLFNKGERTLHFKNVCGIQMHGCNVQLVFDSLAAALILNSGFAKAPLLRARLRSAAGLMQRLVSDEELAWERRRGRVEASRVEEDESALATQRLAAHGPSRGWVPASQPGSEDLPGRREQ